MSLKNLSAKIKIPKVLKNKLNNKKIGQIYKKFVKAVNINENFIVAVSGGPDSLALAFLSKIYSIQKKL
ncbi:tRNA lysidine(34) synthetase TilS, partial [Candidatus Pelagibacter sp.]|nr:tRNA lysidine(34) synthetase TilS [Candidatus Pelagibacter sp.]